MACESMPVDNFPNLKMTWEFVSNEKLKCKYFSYLCKFQKLNWMFPDLICCLWWRWMVFGLAILAIRLTWDDRWADSRGIFVAKIRQTQVFLASRRPKSPIFVTFSGKFLQNVRLPWFSAVKTCKKSAKLQFLSLFPGKFFKMQVSFAFPRDPRDLFTFSRVTQQVSCMLEKEVKKCWKTPHHENVSIECYFCYLLFCPTRYFDTC